MTLRNSLMALGIWAVSTAAHAAGLGYSPYEFTMLVGESAASGGLVGVISGDLSNPNGPDYVIDEISYNAVYTFDPSLMDITGSPNFTSPFPGQLELSGTALASECWEFICNGSQAPGTWSVLIGGFDAIALAPGLHYLVMESLSIYDETNARQLSLDFGGGPAQIISYNVSPVPLPAAAWFFGSALLGLIAAGRRKVMP